MKRLIAQTIIQKIFRKFLFFIVKRHLHQTAGVSRNSWIMLYANIWKSYSCRKLELPYRNLILTGFLHLLSWWTKNDALGKVHCIIEITYMNSIGIFLLLSRPGAYMIPMLLGLRLVREQCLREGSTSWVLKQCHFLYQQETKNHIFKVNTLYCIIRTSFHCFIVCIGILSLYVPDKESQKWYANLRQQLHIRYSAQSCLAIMPKIEEN